MGEITTRMALGAVGLSLAILCSGCAWWDRPAFANSVSLSASNTAIAPAAAIEIGPPRIPSERPRPLPTISNEPEDFICLDGSRLRVSYSGRRDVVAVSLNGAPPFAMGRDDEAGLTAYRATNLVLRRLGVRVALASDLASVTVQGGDTLGSLTVCSVSGQSENSLAFRRGQRMDETRKEFALGIDPQFRIDVAAVDAHGSGGDGQNSADGFGRVALQRELDHLALARGQKRAAEILKGLINLGRAVGALVRLHALWQVGQMAAEQGRNHGLRR